jgi:preprotein translocase subunit SecE
MKNRTTAMQLKKSRFQFVSDIIAELRKVVWPTRDEAIRLSIMVAAVCAAVGLLLGALDFGFSELVTKVLLGVR